MEKKLKLSPKQATSLSQIQQQKQQLNSMLQDLNQKESLVVELVLEMNSIDAVKVESIKLDGGFLVYAEKDAVEAKSKKAKTIVEAK